MAVWTISSQEGSGGEEIARLLAECGGVPLIERELVEALARALQIGPEQVEKLERNLPGPLMRMGISAALSFGAGWAASSELRRSTTLRETTELVFREAAHWPCVLVGRGGFAILADHPGAYHVRLWGPLEWRVARYASEHCLTAGEARRRIISDDEQRAAYIKRVYRLRLDDPTHFDLVVNVSRFDRERVVDALLAVTTVPARTAHLV